MQKQDSQDLILCVTELKHGLNSQLLLDHQVKDETLFGEELDPEGLRELEYLREFEQHQLLRIY